MRRKKVPSWRSPIWLELRCSVLVEPDAVVLEAEADVRHEVLVRRREGRAVERVPVGVQFQVAADLVALFIGLGLGSGFGGLLGLVLSLQVVGDDRFDRRLVGGRRRRQTRHGRRQAGGGVALLVQHRLGDLPEFLLQVVEQFCLLLHLVLLCFQLLLEYLDVVLVGGVEGGGAHQRGSGPSHKQQPNIFAPQTLEHDRWILSQEVHVLYTDIDSRKERLNNAERSEDVSPEMH